MLVLRQFQTATDVCTKHILSEYHQNSSAGHRKFFFKSRSPQIRNRISIFLIRNRKSAIGRLKSLVRNRKSATTFQDS